jgi:hypothetical protein
MVVVVEAVVEVVTAVVVDGGMTEMTLPPLPPPPPPDGPETLRVTVKRYGFINPNREV